MGHRKYGLTGAPLLAVGDVLAGRYRVEARVAEGWSSYVHKLWDLERGEYLALKTLRPFCPSPARAVAGLRRESALLDRILHPSLVQKVQSPLDRDHHLVLKWIEGRTLKAVLRDAGPLRPAAAVCVARDLLSVLEVLHGAGTVHCDLKPDNVMVVEEGETEVPMPRLLDLGIAAPIERDPGDRPVRWLWRLRRAVRSSPLLGPALYRAPEQSDGVPITLAIDVYKLGVLLFEMLTGRPPFAGDSVEVVENLHRRMQPPPVPLPEPWSPLRDVLERALAKSPSERFRSAREFRLALEDVKSRQPLW